METKSFIEGKNFKGWKGPGVVLGQDGQFVLIRHGGAYYRVHPCQLMKEKVTSQTMHKQEHVKKGFCKGSSSSHGVDKTKDGNVITLEGDEQDDISDNGNVPGHVESNLRECADNEDNATQGVASEKDVENNVVQGVTPEYNTALKPKRNSFVKFQSVEGSEWQHVKILSGQPKQTGKYGKWVNVHVMGEEEARSIDRSQVHNWRNVPYPENVVMMTQDEELAQEVVMQRKKKSTI